MNARRQSTATALFALLLAVAVLVLGVRNRALQERNRALVRRFTEPHPGMLVPSFAAATIAGDSAVVGAASDDRRQIVFFFTTTCSYCRASIDKLRVLDAALQGSPSTEGELVMVGLDSAAAVRRYADSLRLSMTVVMMPSKRVALLYRVRAVPQLMVLDSAGRAVFTRAGPLLTPASVDSVLAVVRDRPARAASGASPVPD